MPSLNLDLPQVTLDEVSRLAQKFNVHRVDIFVQAVAKLAQSSVLEQELNHAHDRLAEASRLQQALEQQLQHQQSTTSGLSQELKRVRQQAAAQTKILDERDRQKVLAVMRDQEVKKIRRHAQEVSMIAQELEKEVAYQRMDVDLKTKKIENLSRQLEVATKQKKKLEAGFVKQQKESFKSERQIGRLMQERAKLRKELQHLARILNRGLTR